jgi:enoyl-CoA hydratase/carnithine racemase
MDYQDLVVEICDDFVGVITLNRPDRLNTFSTAMACELVGALEALEQESAVRVILINAVGKAFCAGIDIKEFFDHTAMEYRAWIEVMEKPLVAISRLSKPVIAQVQGVAAANGAGLVAAADLAVAAEDARIGLTAINVGLNCIGPVIPVSRSVGRKRALEMLLFGELYKARDALAMGLVNKVVPAGDLDRETRNWATVLAKKSPIAVQIAKEAFYTASGMEDEKAFQFTNEAFARLCTTEDAAEGIRAFLEKRKPEWKQR